MSYLPFAARGFFDNGGQRLFIARVTRDDARTSSLTLATSDPDQQLVISATGPGAFGDRVFVRIQAGTHTGIRLTLSYYRAVPTTFADPPDIATVADPDGREPDTIEDYDNLGVPPSGHIAGIYARTDAKHGVHKAPANEVLSGVVQDDIDAPRNPLEFTVTKHEQDILNPRGVNVIRDFRAVGRRIRVWGARTISSDPEWRYVNIRRLLLFIEESIHKSAQWVVFEPNDELLWARVRQTIRNFLLLAWRSGALEGEVEEKAFFVRCDMTTMSQADIDEGRLICVIGVAPEKPAEFVIIKIHHMTASDP